MSELYIMFFYTTVKKKTRFSTHKKGVLYQILFNIFYWKCDIFTLMSMHIDVCGENIKIIENQSEWSLIARHCIDCNHDIERLKCIRIERVITSSWCGNIDK